MDTHSHGYRTFMKLGPPVTAPSLAVVAMSSSPLSVPCCTVGYHFSMTLSPNAKASFSNSSFRTVINSRRKPVSICASEQHNKCLVVSYSI